MHTFGWILVFVMSVSFFIRNAAADRYRRRNEGISTDNDGQESNRDIFSKPSPNFLRNFIIIPIFKQEHEPDKKREKLIVNVFTVVFYISLLMILYMLIFKLP